jgi:aspartate-semialdehyde dehydrogenase
MEPFRVGILGATGMVGQRFVQLLANHPWFEVKIVAASPQSAGRSYRDAVQGRWSMSTEIPDSIGSLTVKSVVDDLATISREVDLVFCALAMEKEDIKHIEEAYASAGVAVISNNSAHRWTADVPILMPEINPEHASLIEIQRRHRGWDSGLIVVKPNCSIQSYTSIFTALKAFGPQEVHVTSLQAISGAGKTFETWPEMVDNVIPLIGGEEEKSEREPMKIWGQLENDELKLADSPRISATCIRVPVTDGHLASVGVTFSQKPTFEQIVDAVQNFNSCSEKMSIRIGSEFRPSLPSRSKTFVSTINGQTFYKCAYNIIEAPNNDGTCDLNKATYSSDLCEQLLKLYGKENYLVYDPFNGTGTTGVACKNLNRNFIGIELDENYFEIAKERIENER